MDVNGTKLHLLHGKADWERLYLSGNPRTLAELWQLPEAQQPEVLPLHLLHPAQMGQKFQVLHAIKPAP